MVDQIPRLPDDRDEYVDAPTGKPKFGFYLWCQNVDSRLRAIFGEAADLLTALAGKARLAQVDCWTDHIPKVKDGDIVVQQKINFAGTITNTVTDCESGTCTVTTKIDGVSVGGSANAVSTTESDVTRSSANTFTVGQTISYTISANATCIGARVQISYSRNLSA